MAIGDNESTEEGTGFEISSFHGAIFLFSPGQVSS
jgi:hypothetical protein